MKFDIALPGNNHIPGTPEWSWRLTTADWKGILAEVDRLGFASVTTSEHFAMPYETVPRLGPYWQHALSVMAFLAGATERVRIDATVLVLPYHHPLALAKALSTIDVLSGGRLNVSVGVGHAETEFRVLGVPFAERGAISDEILEAVTTLWREDDPVHRGRYFTIEGLAFEPKPLQQPRPPIYVGGNSKPALRRAARYDGWQPNPTNFELHEVPPLLDYLRAQPDYAGKEDTFELHWLRPPSTVEPPEAFGDASEATRRAYKDQLLEGFAREHRAVGVTRTPVPLPPTRSKEEYLDFLRWFSSDVMPEVG